MIANIKDFGDGSIFICTESSIAKIRELGIEIDINALNQPKEVWHYCGEPAHHVIIASNEDRNLINLAIGYKEITLGEIYGTNRLLYPTA